MANGDKYMSEQPNAISAPELSVDVWFNTKADLTLEKLRGRPVLIHAFQMLCPGCVAHALPQTQKVQTIFAGTDLEIVGLHTVFEHHDAMTPVSLEAFLHEYRITFPVGVDTPSLHGDTPTTMTAYAMRGTPTTILIDRAGNITGNIFGQIEDLALGSMIQSLLTVPKIRPVGDDSTDGRQETDRCDDHGCLTGSA